MGRYVLQLEEIDGTQVALVGGKGAHLAELSRVAGVRVPRAFCVTTDAFRQVVAREPRVGDLLARLMAVAPADLDAIGAHSEQLRRAIEGIAIPDEIAAAVTGALAALDERAAYAVRSSATA